MPRTIKYFFLVLLIPIVITVVTVGCRTIDTDFSRTSISAENLDFSSTFPTIVGTVSIAKNIYGIRLDIHYDEQAAQSIQNTLGTLYAYDPHENNNYLEDVTEFTLTSTSSMDLEHPAGTELGDMFSISKGDKLTSVAESMVDELNDKAWPPYAIELRLNECEIADSVHQFILSVKLSDGRILTDTTRTVRFVD